MKQAGNDPVSPIITTEQHIALWKKQRETTAAEPTGLGFHHLVAGAYNHNIAAIDATISSIPCQEGFSPDLWQVITDFQILKKLGLFDIEFMCTIQLTKQLELNTLHHQRLQSSSLVQSTCTFCAKSCWTKLPHKWMDRWTDQSH
jgi:hypothetical protein